MKSPLTLLTALTVLLALLVGHCFAQGPAGAGQVERMRQRYAPMFRQLGFTDAQGERFIQLKLQQFEINRQVQQEVSAKNLDGGSPEALELRKKLSAPTAQELNDLLGPDGMRRYQRFEQTSFYRLIFVEPFNRRLGVAKIPLTLAQEDRLTEIISAAAHRDREKRTDISTQIRIDWEKVFHDADGTLSADQLTLLREHARKLSR